MKGNRNKFFLAGAACFALLLFLSLIGDSNRLTVITLPFTAIGAGLRLLSLSGAAGNIAAIALYAVIALLPMLLAIKRKWRVEDWLLPLSCVTMLYALYYFINPGLRPVVLSGDVGALIYAGSVYSLFLAWSVIKLLRYCDSMGVSKIYRALRIFLVICAAECIWIALPAGISDLCSSVAAVRSANTMLGLELWPTYVFQFLSFLATALEYGLDALVMFLGIGLVQELETDPYGEACCRAAERTAKWCKISMVTIILAYSFLNLGQMFFAFALHSLAAQFRLPILSLAIVFAMLALTRLLYQGRVLKEDNDLFI